ncbi:hypothetical protein WG904_17550 [Pedobacter sp. Du54]|uniref:hypothetical protein n=1 Tax=Pedobacter anseongensis TaxID=3133439 RepID=UPI0030B39C14
MYQDDPIKFWKNFRLGTELHISGSFIYDALHSFDQIEYFRYEHEVFEFLYNLSVGLERLEKIVVILAEHDEEIDQEEFERTLITHNHLELLARIKKKHNINLGKPHLKLLQFIGDFYRSTRYIRYNLKSVYTKNQDLHGFVNFLKETLHVTEEEGISPMVANDQRVKKFIGKLVGKISAELYELILAETARLNIYTHEILTYSKAYKIFLAKEFTFEKERHLQKEILVLLQSGHLDDGMTRFIRSIEPLPLENYSSAEYIRFLMDIRNNSEIIDEMDTILEDEPMTKERLEQVSLVGRDDLYFQEEDDFDDI